MVRTMHCSGGFHPDQIPMADPKDGYDELIYVFQGGGALGAFQQGAYQALHENGYRPSWLCGISIGSINAAIVAGNPPERVVERLNDFWESIVVDLRPWSSWLMDCNMPKQMAQMSAGAALMFGIPNFCTPNVINPWMIQSDGPDHISFYNVEQLRQRLLQLVDFEYLNAKHTRLSLGAVDVGDGKLVYFDNHHLTITVDHILASCALPPGFPAVKIGTRYYWDGGIYANSPFSLVLSEIGKQNVLCIMVDNFSAQGPLPHSMDGIMERVKDIQFASHSKRQTELHTTQYNLRKAIHAMGDKLTEEQKQDPEIQAILGLGCVGHLHVARVIYRSPTGTELNSKDYDFSRTSLERRTRDGYLHATNLLQMGRGLWLSQLSQETTIFTQDEDQMFATL